MAKHFVVSHTATGTAGKIIPHFHLGADSGQVVPVGGHAVAASEGTLDAAEAGYPHGRYEETWTVVWVEKKEDAVPVLERLRREEPGADVSVWVEPATDVGAVGGTLAHADGRIIPH